MSASAPFRPPPICNDALEAIGNTPMVRLNKITADLPEGTQILAKCEFFNAGGSVKDRIGVRMIEELEKDNKLTPGCTLIEPTSGNTGVGLALTAAVKGYKMVVTMPEKMSGEKIAVLKALGAEIVRTPNAAAFDDPASHIGVANRMVTEIPNAVIPDQYSNRGNPDAHYDRTAEEIIAQTDGKVDIFVCGAGTGGTITGIAKKLKEKCPGVTIVGVDPVGSILAGPDGPVLEEPYQVEGTGYDFIPNVCDVSVVDRWYKSRDTESFSMARRLIAEEGLLCGGSSGATVHYAVEVAKTWGAGKRIVVVLPDSIRNYLSKFVNDDWLHAHDLKTIPEQDALKGKTAGDINLSASVHVKDTATVKEAMALLKSAGVSQVAVVNAENVCIGMTTSNDLLTGLSHGIVKGDDVLVSKIFGKFRAIKTTDSLSIATSLLIAGMCPVVVDAEGKFLGAVSDSMMSELLL